MTSFLMGPQSPVSPTITLLAVIGGMMVLAILDIITREVEDYATIALAAVAVIGSAIEGVTPAQWGTGLLSAAVAFTVYLGLGLSGRYGGGDVKLSVVPAFILGAINPFLGLFWICASIFTQQVLVLTWRPILRLRRADTSQTEVLALPHVPAMTAGMFITVAIFPM